VALVGAARAFENPTTTALVSDVVGKPLVARAMAWLVSATQTARIVGPALGGFLYVIGPGTTYLTAGALFVASGVCTALIRTGQTARTSEPVVLESVLSGIVFIRGQRVLLGTMSLDMFAVLLGGGATALLPIYARDILGAGPGGLGLLRSAPAVGALLTSLFLAYRPLQWRIGRTLFRAVFVFGVATVAFGISSNFALSFLALGVLGAADVVSVVIRSSLVQIRTPYHDARPGERGAFALHRHVQPAGRVRVRPRRGPRRHGARGAPGRHRHDRRRGSLDRSVPRAPPNPRVRRLVGVDFTAERAR
jgi:MFS family permease